MGLIRENNGMSIVDFAKRKFAGKLFGRSRAWIVFAFVAFCNFFFIFYILNNVFKLLHSVKVSAMLVWPHSSL